MVFACYLLLKEANVHINLICFDRYFNNPHINVVTFVPENSPKSSNFFPQRHGFLLKRFSAVRFVFRFSQNGRAFLKNCYLIVTPLKTSLKTLFDCFGVRLVRRFRNKFKLSKWPKNCENRTSKILVFLAKPLDRNGIIYRPLKVN